MSEQLNKTFTEYLEMALRRKWWFILPCLAVFIAAVVISLRLPKVYQASTLILVEPQKVPSDFVKSTITGSVGEWLTTIRQQILSRSLLQKVIDEFGLYRELAGQKTQEEVLEMMRKKITISTVGGRNDIDAFTISFEHTEPKAAMSVANRLTGLFIEANLQVREELVEGTSEFLGQELDRLRQTLEEQEARVSEFKRQHMGDLPSQLEANLRTLDRLQFDLEATERAIKEQEGKASLMRQLETGVIPGAPPVSPDEARLAELKRMLVKLQAEYKESYPDIILTKREIQELESKLSQGGSAFQDSSVSGPASRGEGALLETIEIEARALNSKQKAVTQKIREYERRVEQAPMREQQLMVLVRDYENTQKNYQTLLDKKLNAKISENLEKRQKGELFRILDSAEVPTKPIKPNRMKIALMGLMVGLAMGIGLAVFIEQLDTSFHRQEDLERATGLVVLATIPNFNLRFKSAYAITKAQDTKEKRP